MGIQNKIKIGFQFKIYIFLESYMYEVVHYRPFKPSVIF